MTTGNDTGTTGERLTMRSRMSELAQIPAWIESLASHYLIPGNTQFAINLCLEEVLTNVIRYGYSNEPDHSVVVQFSNPRQGYFVLVVEDEAPLFNPLDAPESPPLSSLEENGIGGQGIRLLRQFADTIEHRPTPTGNRLSIAFSAFPHLPSFSGIDPA